MADTITLNSDETPHEETQEYQQEMVDKAEALENPQEAKPDWLPEKFDSPEDMAKAYAELESKLGSNNNEEIESQQEQQEEIEEFLDEQGIDFNALSQEYFETGGLSDEAYSALAEAGIPHSVVDQYIQGQEALMGDIRTTAFDSVGGENQYQEMMEWAANNLSDGEIDAYNNALDTTNMDSALLAIQGLHARYRSDVGVQPDLFTGDTTGSSAGVYNSVAELTRDMSDPRYESDPAFRQMVARKVSHSNVI